MSGPGIPRSRGARGGSRASTSSRPSLASTRNSRSSISSLSAFFSDVDGDYTREFRSRQHFHNHNVAELNALIRQLWDESESRQAELATAQTPAERDRIAAKLQTVKDDAFKVVHELNQRRLLAATSFPRRPHVAHNFPEESAAAVRQTAQAELIRASRERTIHPAVMESTRARRLEMFRLFSENMPPRLPAPEFASAGLLFSEFAVPHAVMVVPCFGVIHKLGCESGAAVTCRRRADGIYPPQSINLIVLHFRTFFRLQRCFHFLHGIRITSPSRIWDLQIN